MTYSTGTTGSTGAGARRPGLGVALAIHFVAEALAIWVAAALISGFHVYGGVVTYLWIAALFGVVNAVIGGSCGCSRCRWSSSRSGCSRSSSRRRCSR